MRPGKGPARPRVRSGGRRARRGTCCLLPGCPPAAPPDSANGDGNRAAGRPEATLGVPSHPGPPDNKRPGCPLGPERGHLSKDGTRAAAGGGRRARSGTAAAAPAAPAAPGAGSALRPRGTGSRPHLRRAPGVRSRGSGRRPRARGAPRRVTEPSRAPPPGGPRRLSPGAAPAARGLRLRNGSGAGPNAPWLPGGPGGGRGAASDAPTCSGAAGRRAPRGAVTCGSGGGCSRGGEGASLRKGWDLPVRRAAARPRPILGSLPARAGPPGPPLSPPLGVPNSYPGPEPSVRGGTASSRSLCGRARLALLTQQKEGRDLRDPPPAGYLFLTCRNLLAGSLRSTHLGFVHVAAKNHFNAHWLNVVLHRSALSRGFVSSSRANTGPTSDPEDEERTPRPPAQRQLALPLPEAPRVCYKTVFVSILTASPTPDPDLPVAPCQ